jgi:hypothetical protein
MNTINEHNLDEMLFDYLEGNLNPDQAAELSDFLSQNPQYAAELEAWKGTYVEAPAKAAPYAGANALLRPVGGGIAGKEGWAGSGVGIVGTVIVITSIVLFWQFWNPKEKENPVPPAPEVVLEQKDTVLPDSQEPIATFPLANEEPIESEKTETPTAVRKTPQPVVKVGKTAFQSSKVVAVPNPGPAQKMPIEKPFDPVPEIVSATKVITSEAVPMMETQLIPKPVEVAPPPADTIPPTVVQQQDYPEIQGQTKRGKQKKRLRIKKPVRVVPLKSDAF